MGVYWNPANASYYRSLETAARNVILGTQGASGSLGRVSTPTGINYYVDAMGTPTTSSASSGKAAPSAEDPAKTPAK